jgi:hypothetical protein
MTEHQPYDVVRDYDGFELRHYPQHVLVDAVVRGDFFAAGNRGFGSLLGYISGNNAAAQRFAMTAPVMQAPRSEVEHTVSFVLPAGVDVKSVPAPRDAVLSTRVVPPHTVAARRFSGGSSEPRYDENAAALLAALAREKLTPSGSVYFARFDPPWKPGFLRHNEVLVAIAE